MGTISLLDLERGVPSRLQIPGLAVWPIWEPDGERVTFSDGYNNLYSQAINRPDAPEKLLQEDASQAQPNSWSHDGHYLAYVTGVGLGSQDIWILDRETGKSTPFADEPFAEGWAQFSPDGRWIAYSANPDGAGFVVFLARFPGPERPVPVGSGGFPAWSPDGKSLYFYDGNRIAMMSVSVGTGGGLGVPVQVLDMATYNTPFSVHPDGSRFLLRKVIGAGSPTPINIVVNFLEELKESLPVP